MLTAEGTSYVDVADWFIYMDFDNCRIIVLAYFERLHWSLVVYDLERKHCYMSNSCHGLHGNVK